ncbi:histidine phosphatase family protein [Sphingomonas sp. Leaf38]|uniref:histidine phosphatase family protein n=1 Tax=Sphingomonas sp. Leaf38 TaxID=1736217 RepID=UPI0006F763EB|nr:histidine phosphatase family protein [Sphingomonas sp. Leaf38]KQN24662.1 phosphoglycerate mutase [Sphingomonas sp. Leaf38]
MIPSHRQGEPGARSSDTPARRKGRDFVARHGETVFNAAHRLQGDTAHTPLTRAGFAQADELGLALRDLLGVKPALTLWASPTGRALQTLAVICEHLALDWHDARTDARLVEIDMGSWGGRYYADVVDEVGPVMLPGGLLKTAPDGETYPQIAARVGGWLAETADDAGDRLVIMHGISSRVMLGVMTGAPVDPMLGAPIAPGLPQGSVTLVEAGCATVPHLGTGFAPA